MNLLPVSITSVCNEKNSQSDPLKVIFVGATRRNPARRALASKVMLLEAAS
jgi:hypothetical protein